MKESLLRVKCIYILSVVIVIVYMLLLPSYVIYADEVDMNYDVENPHIIINQIYGAGDGGYVSHSFIELYNPTEFDIDISGWSVQYRASQASNINKNDWSVLVFPDNTIIPNDYYEKGVMNCFICMGFMGKGRIIDALYDKVKNIGYDLPVIIDKSAVIGKNVQIGEGSYIGKLSVVNADSRIGKMCIINTGVIVEHENLINDFTHVAVGATLCGRVTIGTHCLVGANSTVIQNVSIENEVVIGSGSVVLHDVLKSGTFYGVI